MSEPPSRVQQCVGFNSLRHDDNNTSPDESHDWLSDCDGLGAATNSVNFRIATADPISTDRGIDQRQLCQGGLSTYHL